MQEKPLQILSTRELPNDLILQAKASNISIDEINFIETRFLKNDLVQEKINHYFNEKIVAIFTSTNAVESVFSFTNTKPDWKIFCTSGATKDALLNHVNAETIIDTAHNASSLADKILEQKEIDSCVFFCGNHRLNTLPDKLLNKNISLDEVVVYETIASAKNVEKNYNGILFFSPSAVDSFFTINKIDDASVLFSIGKTTTKAIRKHTNNNIITAHFPSPESVLKEVRNFDFES